MEKLKDQTVYLNVFKGPGANTDDLSDLGVPVDELKSRKDSKGSECL